MEPLAFFISWPLSSPCPSDPTEAEEKQEERQGPPEVWVHPQAGRLHGLARTPGTHSPEVGFGELLHVELFIGEGCEVDITNGGEHVSWNWGQGRVLLSGQYILEGCAELPEDLDISNHGPVHPATQPPTHPCMHACYSEQHCLSMAS